VLVVGTFLGVLTGLTDAGFLLILAEVAVFGVLAVFVRPRLGLFLIAAVSPLDYLQRFSGLPLSISKLIGVAVAASWFMRVVWSGSLGFLRRGKLKLPFFLIILAFSISLLRSNDVRQSLVFVSTFVSYLVLYFIVVDLIRDRKSITQLLTVMAFAMCLVSLLAILQFVTGRVFFGAMLGREKLVSTGGDYKIGRVVGASTNPNMFAFLPILILPLAFAFMFIQRRRSKQILWGIALLLGSTALALSFARSAYLALGTGLLILLWRVRKRKDLMLLLAVGAVLFSLLVQVGILPVEDILFRVRSLDVDRDFSLQKRVSLTRAGINMFLANPLLGVGLRNFEAFSEKYGSIIANESHNNFLKVASEAGIVGLIPFTWLIVGFGVLIARARRLAENSRDEILMLGFLASFVAYNIHGLFHVNLAWNLFWFVLGLAVALVNIMHEEKCEEHTLHRAPV
jgi:O-antigen ligase